MRLLYADLYANSLGCARCVKKKKKKKMPRTGRCARAVRAAATEIVGAEIGSLSINGQQRGATANSPYSTPHYSYHARHVTRACT